MTNDQARNRGWAFICVLAAVAVVLCVIDGSKEALISAAFLVAVVLFDLWVVYG